VNFDAQGLAIIVSAALPVALIVSLLVFRWHYLRVVRRTMYAAAGVAPEREKPPALERSRPEPLVLPIWGSGIRHSPGDPAAIAARAAKAGVGAIIVLDLARVGMGGGVDLGLISAIRKAAPGVMLLAGGGVRDEADLALLSNVGCDGVLTATMLHNGRLSR
jgi:hypothetical protein